MPETFIGLALLGAGNIKKKNLPAPLLNKTLLGPGDRYHTEILTV